MEILYEKPQIVWFPNSPHCLSFRIPTSMYFMLGFDFSVLCDEPPFNSLLFIERLYYSNGEVVIKFKEFTSLFGERVWYETYILGEDKGVTRHTIELYRNGHSLRKIILLEKEYASIVSPRTIYTT